VVGELSGCGGASRVSWRGLECGARVGVVCGRQRKCGHGRWRTHECYKESGRVGLHVGLVRGGEGVGGCEFYAVAWGGKEVCGGVRGSRLGFAGGEARE
jgi:hypothetical protein